MVSLSAPVVSEMAVLEMAGLVALLEMVLLAPDVLVSIRYLSAVVVAEVVNVLADDVFETVLMIRVAAPA